MSSRARILVVDDERSMQEFLEIFFRREGYDVVTVGDVASALARLENDDFDVVISDLQMPGVPTISTPRLNAVLMQERTPNRKKATATASTVNSVRIFLRNRFLNMSGKNFISRPVCRSGTPYPNKGSGLPARRRGDHG